MEQLICGYHTNLVYGITNEFMAINAISAILAALTACQNLLQNLNGGNKFMHLASFCCCPWCNCPVDKWMTYRQSRHLRKTKYSLFLTHSFVYPFLSLPSYLPSLAQGAAIYQPSAVSYVQHPALLNFRYPRLHRYRAASSCHYLWHRLYLCMGSAKVRIKSCIWPKSVKT